MVSSTDSSVLIRHFSNNLFTPKLNKAKISGNDVVTQRSQLTDSARTALLVRTQGSTPPQSLWPHYVSINQMAEEKWATKPCYKSERKLQVVGQGLSHNNLIQILNWFSWTHPDTFQFYQTSLCQINAFPSQIPPQQRWLTLLFRDSDVRIH